jgi:lysophospholipase L1-like esterase
VMRSSEALFGVTRWQPFTFVGTQLPPTEYARRIEIIGDSITCGYGNEGPNATCPYNVPIRQAENADGELEDVTIPETQNIYLAYGSIAARKLSAEATTLCFSGKGVVLNYREQGVGEGAILNPDDKPDPDAKTTIPEYYKRTLATDAFTPDLAADPNDKAGVPWPFNEPAEKQPQVVLINIGTNDFARDANQDSIADGIDLGKFRAGYKAFVEFVRERRRGSEIFLAVPPMITDLFPLDDARKNFRAALQGIVGELNAAGDTRVHFIELVEMGTRYGLGCDYHPNLEVHRIMADQVVGAIRAKTCWSTVEAQ